MASQNGKIGTSTIEESSFNPNKKPETPFSVSRAAPGAIPKSNAELIDTLISAADIRPEAFASAYTGLIIWYAVEQGPNPAGLEDGMQYVNWGRFGPKEILKDVSNHYLRDLLMDFINTDVAEEKREHTRKAVFSDLNTAEVLEYAALVARWRLDDDETDRRMQIIDGILGDRNPKTMDEIFNIREQANVLDSIDVTIDMTPQPGFASRTHNNHSLAGSVVKQNSKPKEYELELHAGTEIDRNCDQIRAMIKVFTLQGNWTVDQFRLALGHISRSQLTTFMEKRGPREGIHTLAFELGWEFFKKRELLGVPNAPPLEHALENRRALQETDPNRGQKRSSIGGGDYPAKHAKVVGAGDTNVNLAA